MQSTEYITTYGFRKLIINRALMVDFNYMYYVLLFCKDTPATAIFI